MYNELRFSHEKALTIFNLGQWKRKYIKSIGFIEALVNYIKNYTS